MQLQRLCHGGYHGNSMRAMDSWTSLKERAREWKMMESEWESLAAGMAKFGECPAGAREPGNLRTGLGRDRNQEPCQSSLGEGAQGGWHGPEWENV